uniref:Uncharacterized protein n=1 Tax=Gorilla gorilla gorilla TaxID=9595 RepID=A0A2I2ZQ66_GORGO
MGPRGNMNLDREGDTTERRTLPTLQASDLPFEGTLDGATVMNFWRLLILPTLHPTK